METNTEKITHEPSNTDAWVCACGNITSSNGFVCCDKVGNEIEPTIDSGWDELYLCLKCGRIIHQQTLVVVGINLNPILLD